MKKIISIIILSLFVADFSAQSETRAFEDFSALKVSHALEVVLIQGQKNEVVISGVNPDDLEKFKTEVTNGELSIFTKGKIKSKNNIKIELTFKHINQIRQSGASEISTLDVIREDKLSIMGSGAIEADLNIEVKDLTIDFSGASDIKLKGLAENFNVTLSGASDLKASEFIANNVQIDASGASDIKVHATESIKGIASGASSINIKGNPAVRSINSSSSSSSSYGDVNVRLGKSHVIVEDDEVNVGLGKKNVTVNGDTTIIKWGHTSLYVLDDSVYVMRKHKKRRSHWAGVDLAINGFMNSGKSFDLSNPSHFEQSNPEKVTQFMELNYGKSWAFSVNFMEFYFPIKGHHFGLVTGMGTEWNNYELKHNVRLNPEGGANVYNNVTEYNSSYTWGDIDTNYTFSKNRFKTWFINAPLLLEINTGNHKNKSFHVSAGAIFGFNLQTKMKYVYTNEGDKQKVKDKQSFNTNPFRMSLTTRIGYGWFNVFATYSLTPLFENNRGPELYPFTVGVTLVGF